MVVMVIAIEILLQFVLDVLMELHVVEEHGDIVCVAVQDGMVAALE